MKIIMILLAVVLSVPQAMAAETLDEAEIERQIEEARRQIDEAARVLKELSIQKYALGGGGKRAMLGILLGANRADDGVVLDGVTSQSGAALAGLRGGDKIVVIGDVDLADTSNPNHALSKYMKDVAAGESVPMTVERDGERFDVTVVTKAELELKQVRRAMLGILVGPETKGGVAVAGVTPGSGAAEAGLKAGDKIVVIGDVDLGDERRPGRALSAYMRKVSPGDAVPLDLERGDDGLSVVVVTQAEGAHVKEFFGQDFDFDFDFDFGHVAPHVQVKQVMRSHQLLAVDGDLARYFDVDEGVVVVEPPENSAIKAGDVLLSIDDVEVDGLDDAMERLSALEEETTVQVKRRGSKREIAVDAGEFAALSKIKTIQIQAPDAPEVETVVEIKD